MDNSDSLHPDKQKALEIICPEGYNLHLNIDSEEFGENWANWISTQIDGSLSKDMMAILKVQGTKTNRHKVIGLHFDAESLIKNEIRSTAISQEESKRCSYLESFQFYGLQYANRSIDNKELIKYTSRIFQSSWLPSPGHVNDFEDLQSYVRERLEKPDNRHDIDIIDKGGN